MSANIREYLGREAAWHKAGHVFGRYFSWADILAHKGLDYEVVKEQLEHRGILIDAWGTFRTDTWEFLGSVGANYTVIPHVKGFEMVDVLVQGTDGAHYATAGVLGKGEMVWGLADLKLAIHVGDDVQNGYLLFSTGHDGKLSHTYRICFTRVVCQNTLNIALSEKAKSVFRVRHTKNAEAKLADAHSALSTIQADAMTMEQKLNFLATRKVTRESAESIFDRLFPKRKDADGQDVNTTRRANTLADILQRYEDNDRNAFPAQRGTAYNLLNAITQYTDHSRSTHNADNGGREVSALFGSGDKLKSNALEVILQTADGMPVMKQERIISVPALTPVESSDTPMLDALLAANNL